MRQAIFVILFLASSILALAQPADTDNLDRLLRERQKLITDYEYFNAQNSNFWGKKSKKDLLRIIDTLKEIINKDSEIIREVNLAAIKKQAKITVEKSRLENEVKGTTRMVDDNLYELKTQIGSLQNLQKARLKEISALKEKIKESQDLAVEKDKILVVAGVIALILLGYIFYLLRRIATLKSRKTI